MLRVTAITVLQEAGIKVTEMTTVKNGITVNALVLGEGVARPTLYDHTISSIDKPEELIALVKKALERKTEFNTTEIMTRAYFFKHAISCVRHKTDDNSIVKFPALEDLEEYIRIFWRNGNEDMSVVVKPEHLKIIGVSDEELRTVARLNTLNQVTIKPLSSVLAEMNGEDVPDVDVYVATTASNKYGASVLLFESVLADFCKEHDWDKLVIVPSSVHEVMFYAPGFAELGGIDALINEVNGMLEAREVLSDHAYYYNRRK